MPKTRFIQFRTTKQQFEMIKRNAEIKGYVNLSSYLRDLALNRDNNIEKKIFEMHEVIVNERS